MSNHGSYPFDGQGNESVDPEANKRMREMMKDLLGEYPEGKLNKDDEGALAFMVAHEKDKVLLKFPKPVAWLGMPAEQAVQLAQLLVEHAREAGFKSPFSIRL